MQNYFDKPIIPPDEKDRLQALRYFDVISELPDEYFTGLAKIIAHTFNAPIALISIVAEESVYFRGNHGMEGVSKVDRGKSLCSLAVLDKDPTVFEDAINEPCLLRNPLVHGEFGLRFYAGVPIITKEGFCIGTACIVDKSPRTFTDRDHHILKRFAETAMEQLYLNYQHRVNM